MQNPGQALGRLEIDLSKGEVCTVDDEQAAQKSPQFYEKIKHNIGSVLSQSPI